MSALPPKADIESRRYLFVMSGQCRQRAAGLSLAQLLAASCGKRRGEGKALSATCGAIRRRQMRDIRYDRDASSDDQNQRKDYCYLFYNRVPLSLGHNADIRVWRGAPCHRPI